MSVSKELGPNLGSPCVCHLAVNKARAFARSVTGNRGHAVARASLEMSLVHLVGASLEIGNVQTSAR